MSKERKLKLLEMFNEHARLGRLFGMKLAFDEQDRALITLPYNPNLDHALGGTHGGVIATLLDNAGWFTCAVSHAGSGWVATSEMSLHLLRPAMETDLIAKGELLKRGRRQDVAEMRCFDRDENLVAHATGTFIYLGNLPIREK